MSGLLPNDPLHVPKTVKPRNRHYVHRQVIAVTGGEILDETGELLTMQDLIEQMPKRQPTLFVTANSANLLGYFHSVFFDPNRWQWRTSVCERAIVQPDGKKIAARVSVAVHYFGWKGGNYHKAIDPITMYGHTLNTIWPGDDPPILKLLRWGITLRDFCDDNGIDVRPTIGGISAQFLTDSRFYRNARRKIPAAINARVREYLPGNHYHLAVRPTNSSDFTAYYLDQHRAHHYHAKAATFPDSDHCYAYGRFNDLRECVFNGPVSGFHGLYCLDLDRPKRLGAFTRSWLGHDNLTARFVFSNELPHLFDLGYTVTGVRAAWGSLHRDTGINRYAKWCESQLDHYHDPPWLKPLLLSTYGVLATKPKYAEAIFRLARRGEEVTLPTRYKLTGKLTRGTKKLEPRIANVIHRGMIEAATRSESIGFAQWLNWQDQRVLSIYADAVIVEADDDKSLPLLPDPWRCKQTLNHLQFINQQAFTSGEMTKLPGISGELRNYTIRVHAPRLTQNVAELMEREETANALIIKKGTHHGHVES